MHARADARDDFCLGVFERSIAHRGPDGTSRYTDGNVAFVATRLAIIDLEHGDQPFLTPDGAALVANGEIYNDPQLRAVLPQSAFRSGSDCESPLYLYRRSGLAFAGELRGMYAIAIHDKPADRLVLTRDPFGIKPLYYTSGSGYFAFASEPEALIAAGLAMRQIDPRKSAELVQLKFTTGRETIFSGIERALPGETLVVSGARIVERHRRNLLSNVPRWSGSDAEALAKLDAILVDSVNAHMRSDVPYGLFLSGGIDSSALLAAMAKLSPKPVTAFTAAYPGGSVPDESNAASRVARATGADHRIVELTAADFWELSPKVAAALDDPTTDAAALPTYKLAAAARRDGIKVVLSGEGADEVFGGYSRYRRAAWFGGIFGRKSRTHGALDKFTGGAPKFAEWRSGLEAVEREQRASSLTALQRLQATDSAEWLPNDLLVKLDRCLMAHGVEGRTPYLDPVVAPFAFGLPNRLKVKNGMGKWLLRKWLADNLPAAEAFARKKGFNPPMGEWIATHRKALEELVPAQPGIAELSLREGARGALAEARSNSQAAWNVVFYALWHSIHALGVTPEGTIGDVLSEAARRG